MYVAVQEIDHPKLRRSQLAESVCREGCREMRIESGDGQSTLYVVSEHPTAVFDVSNIAGLVLLKRESDEIARYILLADVVENEYVATVVGASGPHLYFANYLGGALVGIAPTAALDSFVGLGIYEEKNEALEAASILSGIPLEDRT